MTGFPSVVLNSDEESSVSVIREKLCFQGLLTLNQFQNYLLSSSWTCLPRTEWYWGFRIWADSGSQQSSDVVSSPEWRLDKVLKQVHSLFSCLVNCSIDYSFVNWKICKFEKTTIFFQISLSKPGWFYPGSCWRRPAAAMFERKKDWRFHCRWLTSAIPGICPE